MWPFKKQRPKPFIPSVPPIDADKPNYVITSCESMPSLVGMTITHIGVGNIIAKRDKEFRNLIVESIDNNIVKTKYLTFTIALAQ